MPRQEYTPERTIWVARRPYQRTTNPPHNRKNHQKNQQKRNIFRINDEHQQSLCLIYKMDHLGITQKTSSLINNIMTERIFHVEIGNELSEEKILCRSSPRSNTLFSTIKYIHIRPITQTQKYWLAQTTQLLYQIMNINFSARYQHHNK